MTKPSDRVNDLPWLAAKPGGVWVVVSWQSDGVTRLASAGSDQRIMVWDPDLGTLIGEPLVGHTAAIWAITTWSDPQGHTCLASAGEDRTIRIWNLDLGVQVGEPLIGHEGWVVSLASWSTKDGRAMLVSGSLDGTLRLWDVSTGSPVGPALANHGSPVWAVRPWRTTAGEQRLASTSDNGVVLLWDVEQAIPKAWKLSESQVGQWDLATWTTHGGQPRIAAAGTDGRIQVWDPEAGEQVGPPMTGHTAAARALTAWKDRSTGGKAVLASAGADGTIRFWDPETGTGTQDPMSGHTNGLPALTSWVTDSGEVKIASIGNDGAIHVWDVATGLASGRPMTGHVSALWTLAHWTDAEGTVRLASAGDDSVIRIWNSDTGSPIGEPLTAHKAALWGLTVWTAQNGERRLASAGDEGSVRIWNADTGEPVGDPMTGHSGWVPALVSWTCEDGSKRVASGGIDTTIRLWDGEKTKIVGDPLVEGSGWVMCLTPWRSEDGRTLLAAGRSDGTIQSWDPDTSDTTGEPYEAHQGWVRSLTSWIGPNGPRIASSGFDNLVKIWDPVLGEAVGQPLVGHTALVAKVIQIENSRGQQLLVSGSDDATIRIWDAQTGLPVGDPLIGHASGVWALVGWSSADGSMRLASAGYDGTVRLWDLDRQVGIRTIEVGPLTMWGFSDSPAAEDFLDRSVFATSIAHQLFRPDTVRVGDDTGPMVVSVEGPWGCGKTTLMEQIRSQLPPPPQASDRGARRMKVREAVGLLSKDAPVAEKGSRPPVGQRGVVTAWFNPWAHESGEQIWAGLVYEILEAASAVLYPNQATRERYWFTRNLGRLDRFGLRRVLLRRTVSPLLGVALAVVVLPLAITFADLGWTLPLAGRDVGVAAIAMVIVLAILIAGIVHTVCRYRWSPAARFLPSELMYRPLSEDITVASVDGRQDTIVDPLRRARAGSLYLHQHDVGDLLADLASRGSEMVVFVDDIDRCRESTTAEVFEAINLFLSGLVSRTGLRARFVIGLDPIVVAAHLDSLAADARHQSVPFGDDPTPGWAFLRKLIQLPVIVPQVSESGIERFVERVTALQSTPQPLSSAGQLSVEKPRYGPSRAISETVSPLGRKLEPKAPADTQRPNIPPTETIAWRALEQHPDVRQTVLTRLADQPDRSIREAKRLLNLWQLYQRILAETEPVAEARKAIDRARNLVILCEVVTRWPALQRQLHRTIGRERGLRLLAQAAYDDEQWSAVAGRLWSHELASHTSVTNLRELLRRHDGLAISTLADKLL